MTVPAGYFFALSVILFVLGIIAFFLKRDLISQFMAIEVMLNSANLAFLALARGGARFADAQAVVFFVVTVAAAEAAIGLAIIMLIFRRRKSIRTADLNSMKG